MCVEKNIREFKFHVVDDFINILNSTVRIALLSEKYLCKGSAEALVEKLGAVGEQIEELANEIEAHHQAHIQAETRRN